MFLKNAFLLALFLAFLSTLLYAESWPSLEEGGGAGGLFGGAAADALASARGKLAFLSSQGEDVSDLDAILDEFESAAASGDEALIDALSEKAPEKIDFITKRLKEIEERRGRLSLEVANKFILADAEAGSPAGAQAKLSGTAEFTAAEGGDSVFVVRTPEDRQQLTELRQKDFELAGNEVKITLRGERGEQAALLTVELEREVRREKPAAGQPPQESVLSAPVKKVVLDTVERVVSVPQEGGDAFALADFRAELSSFPSAPSISIVVSSDFDEKAGGLSEEAAVEGLRKQAADASAEFSSLGPMVAVEASPGLRDSLEKVQARLGADERWVSAEGGPKNIRVARFSEGKLQVFTPAGELKNFAGAGGLRIFSIEPSGFSVFVIYAVNPKAVATPATQSESVSASPEGRSPELLAGLDFYVIAGVGILVLLVAAAAFLAARGQGAK